MICPFDSRKFLNLEEFLNHLKKCIKGRGKKIFLCDYNDFHFFIKQEERKIHNENCKKKKNLSKIERDILICKENINIWEEKIKEVQIKEGEMKINKIEEEKIREGKMMEVKKDDNQNQKISLNVDENKNLIQNKNKINKDLLDKKNLNQNVVKYNKNNFYFFNQNVVKKNKNENILKNFNLFKEKKILKEDALTHKKLEKSKEVIKIDFPFNNTLSNQKIKKKEEILIIKEKLKKMILNIIEKDSEKSYCFEFQEVFQFTNKNTEIYNNFDFNQIEFRLIDSILVFEYFSKLKDIPESNLIKDFLLFTKNDLNNVLKHKIIIGQHENSLLIIISINNKQIPSNWKNFFKLGNSLLLLFQSSKEDYNIFIEKSKNLLNSNLDEIKNLELKTKNLDQILIGLKENKEKLTLELDNKRYQKLLENHIETNEMVENKKIEQNKLEKNILDLKKELEDIKLNLKETIQERGSKYFENIKNYISKTVEGFENKITLKNNKLKKISEKNAELLKNLKEVDFKIDTKIKMVEECEEKIKVHNKKIDKLNEYMNIYEKSKKKNIYNNQKKKV